MDQPDERNTQKHNLTPVLYWAATDPPYIRDHILRLLKRAAVLYIATANDNQKVQHLRKLLVRFKAHNVFRPNSTIFRRLSTKHT